MSIESPDRSKIETSVSVPVVGAERLLQASARICEIASLAPGWDGRDAGAISGSVVARAFDLMLHLEARGGNSVGPPFTSAPIADGGLQLEWDLGRSQIEVQIAPDGTFGFLIIRGEPSSRTHEEAYDLDLQEIIEVILNASRSW